MFGTEIVWICTFVCGPQYLWGSKYSIIFCFDMRPSSPISWLDIGLGGKCTRRLENAANRRPSSGHKIFESKIVARCGRFWWSDLKSHTIQWSFFKHCFFYFGMGEELPLSIESFGLINFLKYTPYCHTSCLTCRESKDIFGNIFENEFIKERAIPGACYFDSITDFVTCGHKTFRSKSLSKCQICDNHSWAKSDRLSERCRTFSRSLVKARRSWVFSCVETKYEERSFPRKRVSSNGMAFWIFPVSRRKFAYIAWSVVLFQYQ